MSKDKKKVDYIPEDHIVCSRCIYYEKCPMEFKCDTLNRMLNHFGQDFWNHLIEEDEE